MTKFLLFIPGYFLILLTTVLILTDARLNHGIEYGAMIGGGVLLMILGVLAREREMKRR